MAADIGEIVKTRKAPSGLLVMTGHQDGIIAWGRTVSEAYEAVVGSFNVHKDSPL